MDEGILKILTWGLVFGVIILFIKFGPDCSSMKGSFTQSANGSCGYSIKPKIQIIHCGKYQNMRARFTVEVEGGKGLTARENWSNSSQRKPCKLISKKGLLKRYICIVYSLPHKAKKCPSELFLPTGNWKYYRVVKAELLSSKKTFKGKLKTEKVLNPSYTKPKLHKPRRK